MKIHPAIVAALIMGTVLISGQGQMNIVHHEVLPQVLAEQQIITIKRGLFTDRVDIRLPSEIKGHESVRAVIKVLQEATTGDVIVFHLAGFGGEVETVFDLINNVHASKAHVIMSVEAPVYSGHAYLAVNGDELIMLPYSSLMFHTSSALGTDCTLETGTDRTVSNVEHCQSYLNNHFYLINKAIILAPVLTPLEKGQIISGHDVYITADEYNKRMR
jgi:ATP-dependent protease ClpP protease subunit